MALRDEINRLVGTKAGSAIAKSKGSRVLKGDVAFDVQQKGDAYYLIVNVGRLKYRIPMAGDKKPPHKFFKDYVGLEPHYDSGWVNIDHSNDYDFTHNLGTKMLLTQVYLRDDSNRIHNISSTYTDTVYSGDDIGIWLYMETANKINVGTGNHYLYMTDNTSLGGGAIQVLDGHLRIFAWKIGKTE